MPNIDVDDFLAGEGLEYRGYRRSCVATYRAGVGILIHTPEGEPLGVSLVARDDYMALNLFYNLTRGQE
jgi:hypothetical protein